VRARHLIGRKLGKNSSKTCQTIDIECQRKVTTDLRHDDKGTPPPRLTTAAGCEIPSTGDCFELSYQELEL